MNLVVPRAPSTMTTNEQRIKQTWEDPVPPAPGIKIRNFREGVTKCQGSCHSESFFLSSTFYHNCPVVSVIYLFVCFCFVFNLNICLCTCVYKHTICVCTHVCEYMWDPACLYVCVNRPCVCVCVCVCVYTCAWLHVCMCVYMHMCGSLYVYMCVCVHHV